MVLKMVVGFVSFINALPCVCWTSVRIGNHYLLTKLEFFCITAINAEQLFTIYSLILSVVRKTIVGGQV